MHAHIKRHKKNRGISSTEKTPRFNALEGAVKPSAESLTAEQSQRDDSETKPTRRDRNSMVSPHHS